MRHWIISFQFPAFWPAALISLLAVLLPRASAASPATVEDAARFLEAAQQRLLKLVIEADRAAWIQATYITDDTEILAASIRHPLHVVDAALAGADVATIPFSVVVQLLKHPLTDIGQEKFLADWKKLKQ